MGRFLTSEELIELTGAKTRKAQARFLDERGYVYEVNRLGHIRLLWAHVEARLGAVVAVNSTERATEPDYAFFNRNAAP